MNNNRRKEIRNVIEQLESIQTQIENIRDDEQDCIDNMPENLQESECHETAEADEIIKCQSLYCLHNSMLYLGILYISLLICS